MSFIKVKLSTDPEGTISIDMTVDCSINELEVATAHMMGSLAHTSTTGLEVLRGALKDIEESIDERVSSSEKASSTTRG